MFLIPGASLFRKARRAARLFSKTTQATGMVSPTLQQSRSRSPGATTWAWAGKYIRLFRSLSVIQRWYLPRPSVPYSLPFHSSRGGRVFFIDFSWAPTGDAFSDTPARAILPFVLAYPTPDGTYAAITTELITPMRRIGSLSCASTLRRTRTAPRRAVSDRKAMRQLVNCIGLSAREEVLTVGRTPRSVLASAKPKTLRIRGDSASASIGHSSNSSNVDGIVSALTDVNEDKSDDTSANDAPQSPGPSLCPRCCRAGARHLHPRCCCTLHFRRSRTRCLQNGATGLSR
jgi:hypothetical protein